MNRRLAALLIISSGAVMLQQQLLLRRPPRLLELNQQQRQSGTAALDLRFSRAMERDDVASESQLIPSIPHRWLGDGNRLRLMIDAGTSVDGPLELNLAGRVRRRQQMKERIWWWDPRPWLIVTRELKGGEQLQLQDRTGAWHPLSPVWSRIESLVPLGDGRGIAMVTSNPGGEERIWMRRLQLRNISEDRNALQSPRSGPLKPVLEDPVQFGHLSSNLSGDLLVQSGGIRPGSERIELIQANGRRRKLALNSSGPVQLLPAGGGLIQPVYEGLKLRPLIDSGRPLQMLPGSRELGAFCAASGRAVLIRHWPDYRRSIELVIPGLAPRQLHLGDQAVLAVACDELGERIWAVLGRWRDRQGNHELVMIDQNGVMKQRRRLAPWTLKAGTPMQWDATGNRLLLTVTRPELGSGRAGLIRAADLSWIKIMKQPIREAQWLRSG